MASNSRELAPRGARRGRPGRRSASGAGTARSPRHDHRRRRLHHRAADHADRQPHRAAPRTSDLVGFALHAGVRSWSLSVRQQAQLLAALSRRDGRRRRSSWRSATARCGSPTRTASTSRPAGRPSSTSRSYYIAVGDGIVRALRDRPCMLHRFPTGVTGEKVHQKRLPRGAPDWVRDRAGALPALEPHRRRAVRAAPRRRGVGGADVHRGVPPVELPARPRRAARRVAHRPRPDARRVLRRRPPGGARRPRGARRAGRHRLAQDLRRQGHARLRADRAALGLPRRAAGRARVRPRGRAALRRWST